MYTTRTILCYLLHILIYVFIFINDFFANQKIGVGRTAGSSENESHEEESGMHWSIIIIGISVVISTVLFIMGLSVAYKYWQKRKRQREQARFLKLFEDNDDIEDELGIGPLSDSI